MTPEEKSLLERTYKMAEENNKILLGMRRSQRIGTVMRLLYWIMIIVATIDSVYFAKIYINSLTSALTGNDSSNKSLIDTYKGFFQ